MSSQKVYDASYTAALIGGEAGESDDEFLMDSDEEDEEYIPPLPKADWNDTELDNDSSDSGRAFCALSCVHCVANYLLLILIILNDFCSHDT